MSNKEEDREEDKYLKMLDQAVQDSLRQLPTLHCQIITEKDQTILLYKDGMGDFEIRFKPSIALDAVALNAGKHFAEMALKTKVGSLTLGEAASGEKFKEEWPKLMSAWFRVFYAHLLGNNAAIALRSTMRETDLIMGAFMQLMLMRPLVLMKGLKSIKVTGIREQLECLVKESDEEKREMLEGYLSALQPMNLERLQGFYDALYPVWCDIQNIAAQHEDAWRDMVTAKYKGKVIASDAQFENLFVDGVVSDLFSRITGNFDDLTEAEEKIIEAHDSTDTPSAIAIEHAARLCGAWRYQFSTRTLFRKLGKQRDINPTVESTDTEQ
jgi:hypothetical protein